MMDETKTLVERNVTVLSKKVMSWSCHYKKVFSMKISLHLCNDYLLCNLIFTDNL